MDSKECPVKYAKPELYYSAGLDEIASQNYSLVPSRYIEFVDRDTALDYKTALQTIGAETKELIECHKNNQDKLIKAFETLGYNME